jgi:signal transduction histidine kinase
MAAVPSLMIWRRLKVLLIVMGLQFAATCIHAQGNLIQSVELMSDPTAVMGVEEAVLAPFRPSGQTVASGYSTSAQWFRMRILPAPGGGDAVLIVGPAHLDSVLLYVPSETQDTSSAIPRYRLQAADWPTALRGYRLRPPPKGADYYLRIVSNGSLTATFMARPSPVALRLTVTRDMVQFCYLAVMIVLLLWALRMRAFTQDRLFGWFGLMQAAWLCHNLLFLGYAAVLLPGLSQHIWTSVFRVVVFVTAFLCICFHRALLVRFQSSVLAMRLFDLQLFLIAIAFGLFWTYAPNLGLKINALCVAATPIVLLINIISARKEASPGLSTIRVIYSALSLALLSWVLPLLGVGPSSVFSTYGVFVHGLSTGVLMFTILHLHGRNLADAAREASERVAEMEHQRTIQLEKNRTLAQFIDMLTHEARNALSVINMSFSVSTMSDRQRDRVADAIQGLTGVIDRCNQTIRLDSNGHEITTQSCDLAAMLRRLCDDTAGSDRILFKTKSRPFLQSDPVLLGVVFTNLIDNALKYAPESSVVVIELKAEPGLVTVMFDNRKGECGMPDANVVFEKY